MFCGFVKSIPLEIEESAMIDGCTPIQTYFKIVFPVMRPTAISVAILEAMWVWNDYLLPYLVLDIKKYKTIPIAIQYLKGGYGAIDMGAMMAMIVLPKCSISAILDNVNITIWNGTIIENANRKYIPVVNVFFTLVIYHAHIEVHNTIKNTEPTVINKEYPNAFGNSIFSIPLI